MKKLLIWVCMTALLIAETEFSEPKPSIMEPRKIIFSISSDEDKEINHVLSTANNVLKFYGPEKVDMEIIAYAGGMKTLLKDNKKIAVRVRALMLYEVTFIACGNTMRTKKIDKTELIEDTEIVTAGVAEIIEKIQDGYIHIKP